MNTVTLRLGKVDKGLTPNDQSSFFLRFHQSMSAALKKKMAFRDEGDGRWRKLEEVAGNPVSQLQQFLKDSGFMPHAAVDGVFGYQTHAGVRLFQEYIRTVDKDASIGTPDGIAGKNTYRFIEKWKKERTGKPEFVCTWGRQNNNTPSAEFTQWINLLKKAKAHYLDNPHPILQFLENRDQLSDTRKIKDWDVSPQTVHLIGIRRNQDAVALKRENDDLFILLINGLVFKFWGSTDPSQTMAFNFKKNKGRKDEAFLVEGQHHYKFGWHKVSDGRRVYRAMRPAKNGVMVFRDRDDNNALTEADIIKGLDKKPNFTINIHWSGKGHNNYSAGCQVIAGKSYINSDQTVIDCSAFASPGYDHLSRGKTRAAYNMMADLILNYSPPGVHTISFMLARDETFFLSDKINDTTLENWVTSMKTI